MGRETIANTFQVEQIHGRKAGPVKKTDPGWVGDRYTTQPHVGSKTIQHSVMSSTQQEFTGVYGYQGENRWSTTTGDLHKDRNGPNLYAPTKFKTGAPSFMDTNVANAARLEKTGEQLGWEVEHHIGYSQEHNHKGEKLHPHSCVLGISGSADVFRELGTTQKESYGAGGFQPAPLDQGDLKPTGAFRRKTSEFLGHDGKPMCGTG